jgi:hypothetical protein
MYTVTTNADWRVASANSTVAFQVTGAGAVFVGLGTNAAPAAGFLYEANQGDRGALTDIFPASSGNVVWVRSSFPSEVTLG